MSGRVDSLELPGAEFKQVRCIVHLPPPNSPSSTQKHRSSPDLDLGHSSIGGYSSPEMLTMIPHGPADLQLSFKASGLIGADVFRGVRLVLDLGNKRVAVFQHAVANSTKYGW